jgi:pyruvate dehydrogenase E2 component (dihydrolipoamide acetyltransferase)
MATPIVIPQLGLVEEIVVLEWLKADGDTVTAGEPLVLLETDKAQTEVEAPAPGVLRIDVPAGPDVISVETVLGEIVST